MIPVSYTLLFVSVFEMISSIIRCCVFSFLFSVVQNANILAIIPSPFYSHQAQFRPLWRELAKKGHNITLFTTNPFEANENITVVDLSGSYEILEKHRKNGWIFHDGNIWDKMKKAYSIFHESLEYQMTHPDLERFKNTQSYKCDLILAEVVFPNYYVLGKILDCPLIGISSMDAFPFVHSSMGNAIHPVMYGYVDFATNKELTFKDRLRSTFLHLFMSSIFTVLFRELQWYVDEYIGKDLPKIPELHDSLSLLIVNANPVFHPIRPSTPLTINVGGGLHLLEPKSLPKDLKTYLDAAKDGCIYFSYGSTVNSNYLSGEALEIFRKTFQELAPIKVLWKFENDTMAKKPENVELRKWLPQQDILRHPNVKLFITQGGLQSMEEAIDSAVPMLGMPFYGDQINNVKKMVEKEFGLRLDVKTMDSSSLKNSILELLNNPKYKKNIDRLSAISKDQPMRPLEKAVWWTEYVLRHKTTEHLRSPSADIPLYQYFFLDIMAFLLVVFIFTGLLFYYCFKFIRWIFRALFCKKNKIKVN